MQDNADGAPPPPCHNGVAPNAGAAGQSSRQQAAAVPGLGDPEHGEVMQGGRPGEAEAPAKRPR
eukprot:5431315-Alexandrium_andersonii.AAC.1